MRRFGSLFVLVVLCVAAFQGVAIPAETSSVQVDSVTVGGTVSVTGTLLLGTDATNATKVGSDVAADSSVDGIGLDVGDAFVTPNIAGKRLTLSVNVNDGLPGIDGITPGAGYVWPLAANGSDNNTWLAAGTLVSGWPPKTEKWFELCSTSAGSYTCGTPVTGTMTASQIAWTVPFGQLGSGVNYGSTLEVGASTPGSPGTIPWAVVSGGSSFDVVSISSYRIPGRVEVGIAPAGTLESNVQYTSGAPFNATTSKFTVTAPKPAPGSYTLFVRSCFGLDDDPTCVNASQPLTI
jgi:hypothetical protein